MYGISYNKKTICSDRSNLLSEWRERYICMKKRSIWNKYGKKLMVSKDEFQEYARGRPEMNVIEFENFQKFSKPVVPKRFVAVSGKYIYEDEFKTIVKNKD